MDGLYEIVPGCVNVEIGGRSWQLGPLRLADYAAIERRLLQRLEPAGAAFEAARNGRRACREELHAWLRGSEGILYELWLRLRQWHPALTLAIAEELFAPQLDEISDAMAIASQFTGEYPLGNASSRGPTSIDRAAANRFLGVEFSAA